VKAAFLRRTSSLNASRIELVLHHNTWRGYAATKGEQVLTTKGTLFASSFENRVLDGPQDPHRFPLPQAGEGADPVTLGAKNPLAHSDGRARVRAISLSVGERKLMNHFVVKKGFVEWRIADKLHRENLRWLRKLLIERTMN
jgi:hypothetical protein